MCARIGAEAARLVYDAAWGAVVAASLLRHAGRTGPRFREKSGRYGATSPGSSCWLHACSTGEAAVALRLAAALRALRPDLAFTFTTQTPEGHALASARLEPPDEVRWFPHDTPGAVGRAFDAVRPEFVVLVEVEFWPNHLRAAAARGIPVFAVNARLTPAEVRRYRLGGSFLRRAFAVPCLVCTQTADDAARFTALGARDTEVTGNMKFDPLPSAGAPPDIRDGDAARPVLLGASTHDGEEEMMIGTFLAVRGRNAGLQLVLAPRHPQRAGSIAALARRRGLATVRVSEGPPPRGTECLLVDTIGDLPALYARATLAFIGKSLTAHGGQNFLEAVEAGCPVVFGPHMENFAWAAPLFLEAEAVVQVADATALTAAVGDLLADAAQRANLAARATTVLGRHRGASARTAQLILERLARPPRPAFTRPAAHGIQLRP
jgi:3-deoxy-D-manno-octulosonic-acid transferase